MMNIGLFIPCYVDALYPQVGVHTYRLLRNLLPDSHIDYPLEQTCCGQPMGNAGFQRMSQHLVEKYEDIFSTFDYVVSPSASCAAYVRNFYPSTFHHPCKAASHTMDIVEFLHDVVRPASLPARFPYTVSLHNSCHGVRELGLSSPSEKVMERYSKMRALLQLVDGITIVEPERPDECCGFGGMFAIEEPHVSACMGMDKLERHIQTGADFITGPDSSCLMHLQGLAKKNGKSIQFKHIVEILTAQS